MKSVREKSLDLSMLSSKERECRVSHKSFSSVNIVKGKGSSGGGGQLKFSLRYSNKGYGWVTDGSGEGQLMLWWSGEVQVRVKSQKYSEVVIITL